MTDIPNDRIKNALPISMQMSLPTREELKEVRFGDIPEDLPDGSEFWVFGKTVQIQFRKTKLKATDPRDRDLSKTNTLIVFGPRIGWTGFMRDDDLVFVTK